MADVKKSLQFLFDRPSEPLFTPKGENNAVFVVTQDYLTSDYENIGLQLSSRFGEDASELIPLKEVQNPPDLSVAMELDRKSEFSLFIPKHRDMANSLINSFMGVPQDQLQDLLATCAFVRDKVNPQLYNYALSVALLHRNDTKDIRIPNFAETFPSKFVDSKAFQQAREVAKIIPKTDRTRTPIIIPKDFTATDLDEEHRIAYFREDIGINLHHWHWHLVYPFSTNRELVDKDRRGELFFYMHQQIIARYNCERLCNFLPRVKRFSNFREPIPEAYFPKLDSLTSSRAWPPRRANMKWQDVNREVDSIKMTITDIENDRKNIEDAISLGLAERPDGTMTPLTIDMLGNMVEASILSINRAKYGDLHNRGHILAAYVHDPDHRFLELFAIMGDTAINMRDPVFYRWHAFIDDLFQRFKSSPAVPPYGRGELNNPGVMVTGISISDGGSQLNKLNTFWMQSDVDMSRGLDFSDRGAVLVRFSHLNHQPFNYTINVNNTGAAERTTVRIFLSPKNDERNLPWQLADQRVMFIELDRFVTPLQKGAQKITRRSDQSSICIPFESTFRTLKRNQTDETNENVAFNFCGCGWPQHMLIPKGTPQGMPFQLFVMLSNYELDKIEQPPSTAQCQDDASSFCGIKDRLYPDRRAMGFPFDRPSTSAATIDEFLTPNMAVQDITIQFSDMTVQNPRNPQ